MSIYTVPVTCEIPQVVANLTSGNPLEKRIVFCEDKFTLALELAIAKAHGGTFGTHVFTFNRYMHKHLENNAKVLSQEGCVLVVKGLLLEHKNQLVCFKNVYDPNLASTVYELIAQLKSAKVTPEDILRAFEHEKTSGNLKRKLKDIYLLFSAYEEYINSNGLTDGNNRLYRLPEHFLQNEEIKDTHVIIAGFPSLNRTLCEIFTALIKRAKKVDFVVAAGENSGVYTNETFNFAVSADSNAPVFKSEPIGLRTQLLQGLFNPQTLNLEGKYSPFIHLYCAKDVNEEITHIAQIIKREIIAGANYKDYSLCAEDISSYELTVRRVFTDYGIPFFFDNAKNLGKHPLTRLVLSYIDLYRRNFDIQDLFAFVKNPLFITDKTLTDGFENYCIACSLNRRTVKKSFTKDDINLEKYEEIRLLAIEVCSYLDGASTFESVATAIQKMLEKLEVSKKLEQLSNLLSDMQRGDISASNTQAFNKFQEVLSDAVSLLGKLKFPLTEVKNIILSGMSACKVSIIPEYNDCVFVGDFRSAKYNSVKNLFAVGLTDGVPVSKIDSALLCDRDIQKMEDAKVIVEPKIKEVNRRARESACMAISAFTGDLYLSYPTSSISGEECKGSEIIAYVQAIFSQNGKETKIYSESSLQNLAKEVGGEREKNYKTREYLNLRGATFAFAKDIGAYKEYKSDEFTAAAAYYKAVENSEEQSVVNGILNSANAQVGYYTENVNYLKRGLSATAIEGYFSCPYANFLQRGVKLEERKESDIKANELGTMVHEVGETFISKVNWEEGEEQAINLASEIFDQICAKEEFSRFQQSEGGKRAFELIKKESVRFCLTMFKAGKNSDLKPKFLEVSFGGGTHGAIKVKTKHGARHITGKVDRIDANDNYMTVIDYKTGKVDDAKIDLNLYMGQKLQLFLYASAFADNYQPIGAYYFPIANNFVATDDDNLRFVGKTISNEQKAGLIDNSILQGKTKPDYIKTNLTRKKETGELRYPKTLLSERDFKAYMEYSKKVAANGLSEIEDGVILPSPTETACDYCKYHGICGYLEETDQRTRIIEEISKSDILRAVNMAGEDKLPQEQLTIDIDNENKGEN